MPALARIFALCSARGPVEDQGRDLEDGEEPRLPRELSALRSKRECPVPEEVKRRTCHERRDAAVTDAVSSTRVHSVRIEKSSTVAPPTMHARANRQARSIGGSDTPPA